MLRSTCRSFDTHSSTVKKYFLLSVLFVKTRSNVKNLYKQTNTCNNYQLNAFSFQSHGDTPAKNALTCLHTDISEEKPTIITSFQEKFQTKISKVKYVKLRKYLRVQQTDFFKSRSHVRYPTTKRIRKIMHFLKQERRWSTLSAITLLIVLLHVIVVMYVS